MKKQYQPKCVPYYLSAKETGKMKLIKMFLTKIRMCWLCHTLGFDQKINFGLKTNGVGKRIRKKLIFWGLSLQIAMMNL